MRVLGISAANRCKAFTLPEIVVTVCILCVGVAGLMGCFEYGFSTIQRIQENQRATQIMLEKTEAIRLCSWDQVISNSVTGFIPATFTDTYAPTAPAGSQGTVYTGTATISAFPYNTSYSANMRQLTIALQWKNGNITHNLTNCTYIAKDGIQNYVY